MSVTYRLGPGDGSGAGSLNLYERPGIRVQSWDAPPPERGARSRTLTVNLLLESDTPDGLWDLREQIEAQLDAARRASGPYGLGDLIVFAPKPQTTDATYFDVLDGTFAITDRMPGSSGKRALATLALICLPYARGDVYTVGPSSTLTNGLGSEYVIPDVPGDVDALVRLTLSDVSTNGKVINRFRIGRRSLPSMAGTDFTGILDAMAVSPGTAGADTTAMGGSRARITTNSAWQTIARVTAPVGVASRGLFHLFARVRDAAGGPGMPSNVQRTFDTAGGSLPNGAYQLAVVSVDSAGNLSLSTPVPTLSIPSGFANRIFLTWTVATDGAAVANHRVYWRRDANPWKWLATGSASGAYTLSSETGATTADPPTTTNKLASQVRALLSLPSGTTTTETTTVNCAISNSQGELLDLGIHPLPPTQAREGEAVPGWRIDLQGKNAGGAPTLDVDGVWLFPADESATQVEYNGLALATPRDWIIDTRRDGAVTAVLTQTGTTTEAGQVQATAPFTLGPGTNVLVIAADVQNGVSNIADAKYTVTGMVTPRYRYLRGGGA